METCRECESKRIAFLSAKSSDRNHGEADGVEIDGYVPENLGIGGDDYIEIEWCLDCGQIQGEFPVPIFTGEK